MIAHRVSADTRPNPSPRHAAVTTQPTDDATAKEPTDAELLGAVRAGRIEAYGQLYSRHAAAAVRLGRTLSRHQSDVDDLVSETFAKVLAILRGGNGPDLAFRAYLLTTMRNVFYDRARRDRRIEFHDDLTPYETGEPFVDTTLAQLERSYAARAFAKLPERWRMVLWHTEVEGESPAVVAPLLGLTPNGVSALAYRARERLRQMYLQEHITDTGAPSCHWTADRLASSVRKSLPPRDQAKVDQHLAGCSPCHLLYVELAEVNSGLRGVLGPLVLGPAAAGYLKSAALAKVSTSIAVAGGVAGVLDRAAAGLIDWLVSPVHVARRLFNQYGPAKLVAGSLVAATAAAGAGGYLCGQTTFGTPEAAGPGGVTVAVQAIGAGGGSGPAAILSPEGTALPGRARLHPKTSASSTVGSHRTGDDFLISAGPGSDGLVAGLVGRLVIKIRATQPAKAGNLGGAPAKVAGSAALVTLRAALPAGLRLTVGSGGDGWTCAPASASANCTRPALAAGASSMLTLRISASPAAVGLTDVAIVVSSGKRHGAATLRFAVAPVRSGGAPVLSVDPTDAAECSRIAHRHPAGCSWLTLETGPTRYASTASQPPAELAASDRYLGLLP